MTALTAQLKETTTQVNEINILRACRTESGDPHMKSCSCNKMSVDNNGQGSVASFCTSCGCLACGVNAGTTCSVKCCSSLVSKVQDSAYATMTALSCSFLHSNKS